MAFDEAGMGVLGLLNRIGRRAGAALLALLLVAIATGVTLLLLGAEVFAFVLLAAHAVAMFIVGLMVWDQGTRTRHQLRRQHQLTCELLDPVKRHGVAIPATMEDAQSHGLQLRQSIDEHEERIIRYLDAVQARTEVARMRSE